VRIELKQTEISGEVLDEAAYAPRDVPQHFASCRAKSFALIEVPTENSAKLTFE